MKNRPVIRIGFIALLGLFLAACQTATQAAPLATTAHVVVPPNLPAAATTAAPLAQTIIPAITEAAPIVSTGVSAGSTQVATLQNAPATMIATIVGTQVTCADNRNSAQLVTSGAALYAANCVGCHGATGTGSGSNPALAGNADVANLDPTAMIKNLSDATVHPPTANMSNADLAAAISFVRATFGNNAPAVCTGQIDAFRPGK